MSKLLLRRASCPALPFFQWMLSLFKFQYPKIVPFTNETVNVTFSFNKRGDTPILGRPTEQNERVLRAEGSAGANLLDFYSAPHVLVQYGPNTEHEERLPGHSALAPTSPLHTVSDSFDKWADTIKPFINLKVTLSRCPSNCWDTTKEK